MSEFCVDVLVVLDGNNGIHPAYMNYQEACRIQEIELSNAEEVMLRDTPERPLPKSLMDGCSQIVDLWVKIEPNIEVSLN